MALVLAAVDPRAGGVVIDGESHAPMDDEKSRTSSSSSETPGSSSDDGSSIEQPSNAMKAAKGSQEHNQEDGNTCDERSEQWQ